MNENPNNFVLTLIYRRTVRKFETNNNVEWNTVFNITIQKKHVHVFINVYNISVL